MMSERWVMRRARDSRSMPDATVLWRERSRAGPAAAWPVFVLPVPYAKLKRFTRRCEGAPALTP